MYIKARHDNCFNAYNPINGYSTESQLTGSSRSGFKVILPIPANGIQGTQDIWVQDFVGKVASNRAAVAAHKASHNKALVPGNNHRHRRCG